MPDPYLGGSKLGKYADANNTSSPYILGGVAPMRKWKYSISKMGTNLFPHLNLSQKFYHENHANKKTIITNITVNKGGHMLP